MALRHSHWTETGRVLVDDSNPHLRAWESTLGARHVLVDDQWQPSVWDGERLTICGVRLRADGECLIVEGHDGSAAATVQLQLMVDGQPEELIGWHCAHDGSELGGLSVALLYQSGTIEHKIRNLSNGQVAASYKLLGAVGSPVLRVTHSTSRPDWQVYWLESEEPERTFAFAEVAGSAGIKLGRIVSGPDEPFVASETGASALVIEFAADVLSREQGVSPDVYGPTNTADCCNSGPADYYADGYANTIYVDDNDQGFAMASFRWAAPNLSGATSVSSAVITADHPNDHNGANGLVRFRAEASNTPAAWSAGDIPFNRTYRTAYNDYEVPADANTQSITVTAVVNDLIATAGYTYDGTAGRDIAISAAAQAAGWLGGLVDFRAVGFATGGSVPRLTITYTVGAAGSVGAAAGTSTASAEAAWLRSADGAASGSAVAAAVGSNLAEQNACRSKGEVFAYNIMALIWGQANIANIADRSDGYSSQQFYWALHTCDPKHGNQATGEVSYAGYARVPVSRANGFAVGSPDTNPLQSVIFGKNTGSSVVVTHWSLGLASSGSGYLLFGGAFDTPKTIPTGSYFCIAGTDKFTFTED